MPLISWLSPFQSRSNIDKDNKRGDDTTSSKFEITPVEDIDFENLADKVEDMRSKLEWAYELCDQANLQFDKYRTEIYEMKRSLESERDACSKAHQLLAKERHSTACLQGQNKNLQMSLRRETILASQLQARFNSESASLKAMTKLARTTEQKLIDTRLDLEYVKVCTTEEKAGNEVTLDTEAPLPAQPFVVVLVDGDAYKWAPDLGLNDIHLGSGPTNSHIDSTGAGATAATRIRNEVTKHILDQNGGIPITSKIITRVFCNFAGTPGLGMTQSRRRSGPSGIGLPEFALQFTEKIPLFDFFDAGRGKERADDKIRENFHLYLSTPNCHAIFVAACLDNGFARMLEQYSDHPKARQKIVLVSPGYVAIEIQRLGFNEVQWPQVFSIRTPPPEQAAKYEKEKKIQTQRLRAQRSVSESALSVKSTPPDVLPRLLDMVDTWNPNAAMSKVSRGVGFRAPRNPLSATMKSLDLAEIVEVVETDEDID